MEKSAWTILRPHHFMQNLLVQSEAIRREGIVRSPAQEGKIPFIDTRDVAEVGLFRLLRLAAAAPTATPEGATAALRLNGRSHRRCLT